MTVTSRDEFTFAISFMQQGIFQIASMIMWFFLSPMEKPGSNFLQYFRGLAHNKLIFSV